MGDLNRFCSTKSHFGPEGEDFDDAGSKPIFSERDRTYTRFNEAMETLLKDQIGGEGTEELRVVRNREPSGFSRVNSYWWPSFPINVMLLYALYSVGIIALYLYALKGLESFERFREQSAELKDVVPLLGIAVFLVLTFRNNSAYQRWYEGAKEFYDLCNAVLSAARMSASSAPPESAVELLWWLSAILYTAKQQLRSSRHEAKYDTFKKVIPEEIWEQLEKKHDKFQYSMYRYNQVSTRMTLGDHPRGDATQAAIEEIFLYSNIMQAKYFNCWRIMRTPMPFAYLTHLRVFLLLWLAFLPWVFVAGFEWYTLIITTLMSYGVLGVEEAAVEVEQPFGVDSNDLPLDNISAEVFSQIFQYICDVGFDDLGRSVSKSLSRHIDYHENIDIAVDDLRDA